MLFRTSGTGSALLQGAGFLVLMIAGGCTVPAETTPSPASYVKPASTEDRSDTIVGKWEMYPAVGTTSRGCSVEFKQSSLDKGKGRVSMFACHQIEGLGGIHGVSDIRSWERKGRTIVLSGIAAPKIGTIELPADSFRDRVYGSTKDDIRFIMVRK